MAHFEDASSEKDKRKNSQEEEIPLDLLRITVSTRANNPRRVPALNIGFMKPREYITYEPLNSLIIPVITECSLADEEEWIERMVCLEEDLTWLLKLPHYRFWSQVVYDEKLQKCLQSYLSNSPRCYEMNFNARNELLVHQSKVHKLIFSVFLRMSTYKESKSGHMTPSLFAELVYDNFLFDIPRMMDLCVLYGFKNQALVSKMINNIFNTEPKYKDDLDKACSTVMLAFDTVEEQLQSLEVENSNIAVEINGSTNENLSSATILDLLDIVNYIIDISATLHMFLECYPDASHIFVKYGAATRIPHFYDSVLADIQNDIDERGCYESSSLLDVIDKKLALSRTFFLRTFRNILSSCIQCVLDSKFSDNGIHEAYLDSYFQVLNEMVIGTAFKYDYNILFPIEDDLNLFKKSGIKIDNSRVNYFLGVICNPRIDTITLKDSPQKINVNKSVTNLQDLATSLSGINSEPKTEGATPAKPNEIEIVSLISNIKDLLPYGDGFIEKCLEYYNYDSARVIDALLSDDQLPSQLECLDRQMDRKIAKPDVLESRKNIFDHDEFDVFHRENIPMDRVQFGKSNKTPNAYKLLSDPKESAILKELTLKLVENEDEYREEPNLYDDEYDDTYDSTDVTVPEAEAENESLTIRPFTVPRILESNKNKTIEINTSGQKHEDEEEEEDYEETEEPKTSMKDEFCINPEIQREKYQQRREAQARNRYQPRSQRNEDSTSSQNYRNKERHKSYAANHNRRKQSDFKRSRGMAPF